MCDSVIPLETYLTEVDQCFLIPEIHLFECQVCGVSLTFSARSVFHFINARKQQSWISRQRMLLLDWWVNILVFLSRVGWQQIMLNFSLVLETK